MPFEDRENLTDLKTFTDAVYFNDDVHFYGNVYGLEEAVISAVGLGSTSIISKNNSKIEVNSNETITIATNSVGIVTFAQNNIGIANTLTLERTGIVQQLFENVNLSSTALTGTIDLDILSGTLFYYTANAGADWTFNVRGNASTSLNAILPVGKSVTVTVLSTQSTARLASTFKVDGSTISPKWQGGTAPSSGFASAVNIYVYTIIKTADASFTVFASLTKFA
jgi:Zn-dependent alcohol dehydrogenase